MRSSPSYPKRRVTFAIAAFRVLGQDMYDVQLRGALALRMMGPERRGGAIPAGAYARADEAARLFGELCARGGKS